jgi:thymidine kinase
MHTTHFLEIFYGGMFAGKTDALLSRLRLYEIAGKRIQVFKPAKDNRYDEIKVVSHSSSSMDSTPIKDTADLESKVFSDTQIIGIDEVQFLDSGIVNFCDQYTRRGGMVSMSFLRNDYTGKPFPFSDGQRNVLELLGMADYAKLLRAICTNEKTPGDKCGRDAVFSQKFVGEKVAPPPGIGENTIEVGGKEVYAPRCRDCFIPYNL